MEKRKTQKQIFGEMVDIFNKMGRADLVEFCNDRIALIEKKASAKSNAPTKTQVLNLGFMEKIVDTLTKLDVAMSIADLKENCEEIADFTPQKVNALLIKLQKDNRVVRTEVKGKAFFSIVK